MATRTDVDALVDDRYRLVRQVDAGGMGVVWAARDLRLDRDVAVKVGPVEGDAGQRLAPEAELAGQVVHPNTVEVFDAGVDDGRPFIVMELLSGETLADVLRDRGPLDRAAVERLAADLLAGLGAVHRAGILHRDVKPSNVLVAGDGSWKLGDFGIAKTLSAGAGAGVDLTSPGLVMGTAAYMAPERRRGEDATIASDLYSAAALLHEAATGARWQPTEMVAADSLPTESLPIDPLASTTIAVDAPTVAVPLDFLAALEPALAAEPDQRYPSAAAMAAAVAARSDRPQDETVELAPVGSLDRTEALPIEPALPIEAVPAGPGRRRVGTRTWTVAGVLALAAAGVAFGITHESGGFAPATPTTGVPTSTQPVQTTTPTTPPPTTVTPITAPPVTPKDGPQPKSKGTPKGKGDPKPKGH